MRGVGRVGEVGSGVLDSGGACKRVVGGPRGGQEGGCKERSWGPAAGVGGRGERCGCELRRLGRRWQADARIAPRKRGVG